MAEVVLLPTQIMKHVPSVDRPIEVGHEQSTRRGAVGSQVQRTLHDTCMWRQSSNTFEATSSAAKTLNRTLVVEGYPPACISHPPNDLPHSTFYHSLMGSVVV